MKHSRFRRLLLVSAIAAGASAPMLSYGAESENYPTRPVSIVVPFPAGGTSDGFTRMLANELSKRLGQPVVVENRPGANGNIGSAYVAKKPADGYTILYGSGTTLAVNPYIYPANDYSPADDLVPISITHQMPNVLVVGNDTPYKDVASLVADAKANPDKLSYASAGSGNSMHLAAEQFKQAAGVEMVHIPYNGSADSLNDIMGGRVPLMFNNVPAIAPLVKANKLRALAVADTKRSHLMPDVPTMAEAGVPGFTSVVWVGFVMRKGTDSKIIERLSAEMKEILQDPQFQGPVEQGYEIVASTPAEFGEIWKRDLQEMADLTKRIGIRVN